MLAVGLMSGTGLTTGVRALALALALGAVTRACLASALACSLTRFSSAFALVLLILVHSLTILANPFLSVAYLHHIDPRRYPL